MTFWQGDELVTVRVKIVGMRQVAADQYEVTAEDA